MRTIAASSFLCALTTLFAGAPAFAEKSDKQVLRETGSSFADCVAEKHYDEAVAYILESPDNKTAIKKYRRLIDSQCMVEASSGTAVAGIRFSGDTFAFSIAEGLVRRDFGAAGPMSFNDRAPLAHRVLPPVDPLDLAKLSEKKRAEAKIARQREMTWLLIAKFGECAVRLAPESTRKLAQTRVGSPDEFALLQEMAPNFGVCLPSGAELKFQPLHLRGTLLVNYFRLASAPQTQPDGAQKVSNNA